MKGTILECPIGPISYLDVSAMKWVLHIGNKHTYIYCTIQEQTLFSDFPLCFQGFSCLPTLNYRLCCLGPKADSCSELADESSPTFPKPYISFNLKRIFDAILKNMK